MPRDKKENMSGWSFQSEGNGAEAGIPRNLFCTEHYVFQPDLQDQKSPIEEPQLDISPEDEEQAVGLEKADLVQPADQQEAPKSPGSSSWLGLNFPLLQRRKAEKATGRGEGCGCKKEELRAGQYVRIHQVIQSQEGLRMLKVARNALHRLPRTQR
ncbi:hypothetical protein AV530_007821 [Patagioenas fasciata monilis]|uniref:Uncharacterized protein n=1 Tax=Patagioenas fasciata monilis TaxID=372326 RepID=A0A1V4JSY1_PATFA|nr:hypothetical protein AV530_007821 [Patagioenas fasciata monilis]